ncbi:MAG: 3,5-cyclic-AMP phosphodiesterase, partial [Streptomyces sp.]|nr:3,5-cyclic-AMP phosphodiesterase [Streptomyces sp.]
RAEFRKVLLDEPGGSGPGTGPVNQVLRPDDGLTVALCDSSIPGRHDGHLDDEAIAWLDAELARADGPVLVGMHHPPVALGLPSVGLPLVVAPGVVSTLMLPEALVLPEEWTEDDALDFDLPPAITLHVLDGERLVSQPASCAEAVGAGRSPCWHVQPV